MWEESDTCLISKAEQGTDQWHSLRQGLLTASKSYLVDDDTTHEMKLRFAQELCGIVVNNPNADEQYLLDQGKKYEPIAREWYSKKHGIEVKQIGLAVWKKNRNIGASCDGVVNDHLIIEIKWSKDIYSPLKLVDERSWESLIEGPIPDHLKKGSSWPHIKKSHYWQMQQNMAVLGKRYCDYILYSPEVDKVYLERIPYDDNFWNTVMLPKMIDFIENYLKPIRQFSMITVSSSKNLSSGPLTPHSSPPESSPHPSESVPESDSYS